MHAKAILAGDIAGGEDGVKTRRLPNELRQITEGKLRVGVGRADDEQDQRVFGPLVRAINILAGDFALAVQAHNALADGTRSRSAQRIQMQARFSLPSPRE